MILNKIINITWSSDDVIYRADERGIHLTYDQANDILDILEKNHDATIGINWDVIDIATDIYLND